MSIIFGPVPSRRFGISLGIDLSPNLKQCNFDCLYCELKGSKTVSKYTDVVSSEIILNQTKIALERNSNIDVLTITANGEPTLHPELLQIVQQLNQIKSNAKTLILSNGSTISNIDVQKALCEFDIVKVSLDCASKQCFKKLDRNDDSVDVQKILEGMKSFRKIYDKQLVVEVLFVAGLNDGDDEVALIYNALRAINPDRVDIGTIDRPPAYNVLPISYEKLKSISDFYEGLNVYIAFKNRPINTINYNKEQILSLLNRRPLCEEDIQNIMNENSKALLTQLVAEGKIIMKFYGNMKFYKI